MNFEHRRRPILPDVIATAVLAMPVGAVAAAQSAAGRAAVDAVPPDVAATRSATADGAAKRFTTVDAAELDAAARDARLLMAHVAIARTALEAGNGDLARTNVADALPAATRLVSAARHAVRDAAPGTGWVPLQDERVVVHTLDEALRHRDRGRPEPVEVKAVRVRVALDAERVLRELLAAQRALHEGDAGAADEALARVQSSSVTETQSLDLPLERVRDDLVLAQELLRDRDYASSGVALDHARQALAAARADGRSAEHDAAAVAGLGREIESLRSRLDAQDSGVLATAERTLDEWRRRAEAWFAGATR